MEYRLGTSKTIKEIGTTEPLVCPHCGEKAALPVYVNGKTEFVPEFPVIKPGKVYFTVCPHCAAVLEIETRSGQTFAKGEPLAIGNFDFKELKDFHAD